MIKALSLVISSRKLVTKEVNNFNMIQAQDIHRETSKIYPNHAILLGMGEGAAAMPPGAGV